MSDASSLRASIPTLVIEDSATTRAILRERLAKIGCRVVGEAGTPAEGLKLLRELRPKLVTLDLIMPSVDGLTTDELFSRIRDEAPEVAIMIVSSRAKKATGSGDLAPGAIA